MGSQVRSSSLPTVLNHGSSTPDYAQLAAILRAQIQSGELAPGQAIPSEPQMVRENCIARMTARRAIAQLRDERLIYTLSGEGTFVGASPRPRHAMPPACCPTAGSRPIWQSGFERATGGQSARCRATSNLVQEYDCAKETIRRAVALLRHQGWAYTVPRRGTYVIRSTSGPLIDRVT
ncbi:GntR family transcriptional regulator [Microbispora bryophytorum]|uniref:GntR family transcriptional regulator n=1 Tax=Microbispora bryophytorum TaxID=1460882 RepID=UPI00340CC93A